MTSRPYKVLEARRLDTRRKSHSSFSIELLTSVSNPNDIVLDAFCGCGTALVAAQNLGRQWIGIDISPTACRVMAKRLRNVCSMKENEQRWKAHQTTPS